MTCCCPKSCSSNPGLTQQLLDAVLSVSSWLTTAAKCSIFDRQIGELAEVPPVADTPNVIAINDLQVLQ